jgi:phospholipid/cholesterol/gamma-HCH transport system ATP-binding protein
MDPIVSFEDVEVDYDGRSVLKDICFEVKPGEIVGLAGPSGSGKTTLLRHLIGLKRPVRGRIRLFGEPIASLSPASQRLLRRRIGVLFQGGALLSSLNVFGNVALPLQEMGFPDFWVRPMVSLALSLAGLSPENAARMPSELSGGMVTRVALARGLVAEPELLLLDEPTAGLDPIVADGFIALMGDLQKNLGITALMISHDLRALERLCHRLVLVGDGRLIAQGRFEDIRQQADPRIRAFFRLDGGGRP